jgi:SAM-dependent methyltransferase
MQERAPRWTKGYRTDLQYTFGLYPFLNPDLLFLTSLLRGVAPPTAVVSGGTRNRRSLTYCELGCGQGLTLNFLAARDPDGQYFGIDYNPNQISNARNFAKAAKLENVRFLEESFADLNDVTIPDCDVMVMHGIWTWIEEGLQDKIVAFMRRKLKPGGLCFVSYNCAVGRNDGPMRELLQMTESVSTGQGGQRITEAIDLARQVANSGAAYFNQHPAAKERLNGLPNYDRHYVIHEYLNSVWQPRYFREIAKSMAEAKLSYVGSADPVWNRMDLVLPNEAAPIASRLTRVEDIELLKDLWTGNMFRKDVFVKGARLLNRAQQDELLSGLRFARLQKPEALSYKIAIPVGVGTLEAAMFDPVFALLSKSEIVTGRQLADIASNTNTTCANIIELLLVAGYVAPCVDAAAAAKTAKALDGFNHALAQLTNAGLETYVMTFAGIGTAAQVSALDYYLWRAGLDRAKDKAADCQKKLASVGKSIVHNGRVVTDAAEALTLIRQRQVAFDAEIAPLLRVGLA